MENYLAVFTGNAETMEKSGWTELPEEERKARERDGIAAWGAWMENNADDIVFAGGPLGKTKKISASGIDEITNAMAGFVVFRAASHEAAAAKFIDHPHFTIFPGDAVEVMKCLPIPGQ